MKESNIKKNYCYLLCGNHYTKCFYIQIFIEFSWKSSAWVLILTHFTDYKTEAQELLSNIPKVVIMKEVAKCNLKPAYLTLEPVLLWGRGSFKNVLWSLHSPNS